MSDTLAVQASNLVHKYGGVVAVGGVDFEVRQGQSVCIIGPNGAGKTTLLWMLGGALLPHNGVIKVLGMDRWEDNYEIRKRSSYISVTPSFGAALTPYEYLRYVAGMYGMLKADFMERVEVLAREMQMLDNLGKEWMHLSTGMYKKTALIGAFLPDAELRFMDEPFTYGIDPQAIDMLHRWLGRSKEAGESIVYSTQVLEHAKASADVIYFLHKGRVVSKGSADEIIQKSGVDKDSPRGLYEAFVKLTDGELS